MSEEIVKNPATLEELERRWRELHPPRVKCVDAHDCLEAGCRLAPVSRWAGVSDVFACRVSGALHRCGDGVCNARRMDERTYEVVCPLTGTCFTASELPAQCNERVAELRIEGSREWRYRMNEEHRLAGQFTRRGDTGEALLQGRIKPVFAAWFDADYINQQHYDSVERLSHAIENIATDQRLMQQLAKRFDCALDLHTHVHNIARRQNPVSPYIEWSAEARQLLVDWYSRRTLALWNMLHQCASITAELPPQSSTLHVLLQLLIHGVPGVLNSDGFLQSLPDPPFVRLDTNRRPRIVSNACKLAATISTTLQHHQRTHGGASCGDLHIDQYMRYTVLLPNERDAPVRDK